MSDEDRSPQVRQFLARLGSLDPGQRARLRRAAGKDMGEATNVLGLFYRLVPWEVPISRHDIYFLVATLFPMVDGGGKGNLGHALHLARQGTGAKGLDSRMDTLLDSDETQLPFRLRQTIHYLQSNRIRLDWAKLLEDLLWWSHPDRFVQQQWARSYYGLPPKQDNNDQNEGEN
jgi:CRISPR system Cascade subunit CasB